MNTTNIFEGEDNIFDNIAKNFEEKPKKEQKEKQIKEEDNNEPFMFENHTKQAFPWLQDEE